MDVLDVALDFGLVFSLETLYTEGTVYHSIYIARMPPTADSLFSSLTTSSYNPLSSFIQLPVTTYSQTRTQSVQRLQQIVKVHHCRPCPANAALHPIPL
jgi:hypothetical protein